MEALGSLTFSGHADNAVDIQPDASTGLENIYVVRSLDDAVISYISSSAGQPKWYRFASLGGAYAEPITDVTYNGNTSSIKPAAGDMGYIIEDAGRQHCYWVVDYSAHMLDLKGLEISSENDCDRTGLIPSGSGAPIYYYSINGRRLELSRMLTVTYRTLQYDEESGVYNEISAEQTFDDLSGTLHVTAPLTDTQFTLSGDRFLKAWGIPQEVTSAMLNAYAVEAHTTADQTQTDYDNEQKDGESGLGGSAPCEITFKAVTSDAAVFKEWQFSMTPDFDIIDDRYNQDVTTRVFNQNGTTYIRFIAANADGSCYWESDTYTVNIGESRLECPNAFSPANQDGVNDLWKVSYKSIVSFECNIFNRWGKKLCTLTHPSQGWDGKIGNKFAPSGVYFYVIRAKGADGKNYNLSGDINIINSRANPNASSGETAD